MPRWCICQDASQRYSYISMVKLPTDFQSSWYAKAYRENGPSWWRGPMDLQDHVAYLHISCLCFKAEQIASAWMLAKILRNYNQNREKAIRAEFCIKNCGEACQWPQAGLHYQRDNESWIRLYPASLEGRLGDFFRSAYCLHYSKDPDGIFVWGQLSPFLWRILHRPSSLVVIAIPRQNSSANFASSQEQWERYIHLNKLPQIRHNNHNYCASLTAFLERKITDDPHPVVLCVTDNISAKKWTMHTCKKSIIGRALARFFCGLLIGLDVGINAIWISTEANKIADKISRVKKFNHSTHSSTCFDFSKLKQTMRNWNIVVSSTRFQNYSLCVGKLCWRKNVPT